MDLVPYVYILVPDDAASIAVCHCCTPLPLFVSTVVVATGATVVAVIIVDV